MAHTLYKQIVTRLALPHSKGFASQELSKDKHRAVDRDCVICTEPILGTQLRAPCGHYFDEECMVALVEASTRDQSRFPPNCCMRRIPTATFKRYLSPQLSTSYSEKRKENSTLGRVYCANPACSHFLGRRVRRLFSRSLSCPSCSTKTCNHCRTEIQVGVKHECGPAEGDRAVSALASDKGWPNCPECGQLIERRSGCNHMTCVCGTQFCYACGAKWKRCKCSQYRRDEPDEPDPVAPEQEPDDVGVRDPYEAVWNWLRESPPLPHHREFPAVPPPSPERPPPPLISNPPAAAPPLRSQLLRQSVYPHRRLDARTVGLVLDPDNDMTIEDILEWRDRVPRGITRRKSRFHPSADFSSGDARRSELESDGAVNEEYVGAGSRLLRIYQEAAFERRMSYTGSRPVLVDEWDMVHKA